MLYRISLCARRSAGIGRGRRAAIVKTLCLVCIAIIFYAGIRKWMMSSSGVTKEKPEAYHSESEDEADMEVFVRSWVTPSAAFVLPDSVTVLHNPYSNCNKDNGSNVLALFIVVSPPANKAARDAIRSGFKIHLRNHKSQIGSALSLTMKPNSLLFFTGIPEAPAERGFLLNEATVNGDLIVDDLLESSMNLTLKSLRLLKWVERNCYNAEFVIKVDDHFHINMRMLLDVLETLSRDGSGKSLVGGLLSTKDLPVPSTAIIDGKWQTTLKLLPDEGRHDIDEYLAGFFYVFGKKARSKIYKKALEMPMFYMEDVFITGIVAKKALELRLTNFPKIAYFWTRFKNFVASSCQIQNLYLGIHFNSALSNYMECWKNFNSKNFTCSNFPLIISHNCWFQ